MIRVVRRSYVNILKRNPNGVNRFTYMDEYIAKRKHPTIRNYMDYTKNLIWARTLYQKQRKTN